AVLLVSLDSLLVSLAVLLVSLAVLLVNSAVLLVSFAVLLVNSAALLAINALCCKALNKKIFRYNRKIGELPLSLQIQAFDVY
ncbi:hypothetical protein, partial [Peribacillus sp. NPDC058002]|uniref:hypothetical protein n=1 Tax=Peribacillus sp. NPDC058002 TaxID=3346301 RepID=UPI0036DC57C6